MPLFSVGLLNMGMGILIEAKGAVCILVTLGNTEGSQNQNILATLFSDKNTRNIFGAKPKQPHPMHGTFFCAKPTQPFAFRARTR